MHYSPFISDNRHINSWFLLLSSSLYTPRELFMLTAFRYFIHTRIIIGWHILRNAFKNKIYYNPCTDKEYPIKDDTKQTRIQTYTFRKSSIFVSLTFLCVVLLYHRTCANHIFTVVQHLPAIIYYVACYVAGVYNMM